MFKRSNFLVIIFSLSLSSKAQSTVTKEIDNKKYVYAYLYNDTTIYQLSIYENGFLQERGEYKNGGKFGTHKYWYKESTQISLIEHYQDGLVEELEKYYFSGKLEKVGNNLVTKSIKVNTKSGVYTEYYYAGNIKEYFENGKLRYIQTSKNGLMINEHHYNEMGKQLD